MIVAAKVCSVSVFSADQREEACKTQPLLFFIVIANVNQVTKLTRAQGCHGWIGVPNQAWLVVTREILGVTLHTNFSQVIIVASHLRITSMVGNQVFEECILHHLVHTQRRQLPDLHAQGIFRLDDIPYPNFQLEVNMCSINYGLEMLPEVGRAQVWIGTNLDANLGAASNWA